MRLTELPLVIILWTQDGCEHCEATLPPWRAVAARYARCMPSARLEASRYEGAANQYRIQMLPTLMALRYGRTGLHRLEGSLTEQEIESFYVGATVGLDCQLG